MNFNDIPVIDNHCHLFNTRYEEHNLARVLSLSLNVMPEEQLRHTLVYRKILKEMVDFLQMGTAAEAQVLARRQEAMEKDYRQYVADLFQDAGIHTLLIDLGYQPAQVNLEDFEKISPTRIRYMYRIETILDSLWEQKASLAEAEEKFYEALDKAVNELQVVAFKSIIGYRTGLQIRDHDRKAMKKDMTEKAFREYFLLRAAEKAADCCIPIQIHAAFGESNIQVLHNNPLLLKEALESGPLKDARVVLVHGGYPYSFEAGYMAAMYPHVYVDISEMIPFVPLGAGKGLRDMMDMCPLNKIMYGSDGFVLPDLHWLGARAAKRELRVLFDEFIRDGLMDEDYALQTARRIFFDTAEQLYNL